MHNVAVLALDGAIPFDMTIPFQVFGDARGAANQPLYQVVLVGRHKGALRTSAGFAVEVSDSLPRLAYADSIVTVGSEPAGAGVDREVCSAIRRAADRGARLLSICTGAYVLAEAGLLDGKRATTHWRHAALFRERFPLVKLDTSVLYTEDGQVLTSAGAAAGIDLCLHVIAVDHGTVVANAVARSTVSPPHRSGGQAQFIETPLPPPTAVGLERTCDWARQHLVEPIDVDTLARHAAVSRRTLARRFAAETGMTPLEWLVEQRLRLARRLLEESDLSVDEVALRSGIGSAATFRMHFGRALGISPRAYRDAFGDRRASVTARLTRSGTVMTSPPAS